jgi:hypothetical protein
MQKCFKRFACCASAALMLICAGGCAAVINEVVVAPAAGQDADAKKNTPEYELSRNLVIAFIANDANGFVSLLPETTRKSFNAESFAKTRKSIVESMGTPFEFSYVTELELSTFTPHIWKIRFRRVKEAEKEEFTSELLFKVITGMTDKETPVVVGFYFI